MKPCDNLGRWLVDDTFSEYYHTVGGQIEYWLLVVCLGALKRYNGYTSPFWFGAENRVHLYLIHPSYSPFVNNPRLPGPGCPKMEIEPWRMDNPPEGQEGELDEDFIPKALKKHLEEARSK